MKKTCSVILCILLCLKYIIGLGEIVYAEIWGYHIFRQEGKAGLMRDNEIIIDADYDDIIPFGVFTNETQRSEQQAFYTVKEGKRGAIIVHDDSVSIIPADNDDISFDASGELWIVKQNQLYGTYNHNAVLILPVICPEYPRISDDICILSHKKPCSYYSLADDTTFYPDWDEIYGFSEGRCLVRSGDKYGYINKQNECIIPCIYKDAYSFDTTGIAFASNEDDIYCAIDTEGNILFTINGYVSSDFNEYGVAIVLDYESDRYGLINTKGEYISAKDAWDMDVAGFVEHGLFRATCDGNKWGVVNSRGEIIIPFICEYGMLEFITDPIVFHENEAKRIFRIFSIHGEELGSFYCDDSYSPKCFSNGLLLIALSEKERCYIDTTGNKVISYSPALYYLSDFNEGVAQVMAYSNGKYGYMDKNGKVVIDAKYESVSDFYNQFAVVTEDGKEKYINHNGEVIYEKP